MMTSAKLRGLILYFLLMGFLLPANLRADETDQGIGIVSLILSLEEWSAAEIDSKIAQAQNYQPRAKPKSLISVWDKVVAAIMPKSMQRKFLIKEGSSLTTLLREFSDSQKALAPHDLITVRHLVESLTRTVEHIAAISKRTDVSLADLNEMKRNLEANRGELLNLLLRYGIDPELQQENRVKKARMIMETLIANRQNATPKNYQDFPLLRHQAQVDQQFLPVEQALADTDHVQMLRDAAKMTQALQEKLGPTPITEGRLTLDQLGANHEALNEKLAGLASSCRRALGRTLR